MSIADDISVLLRESKRSYSKVYLTLLLIVFSVGIGMVGYAALVISALIAHESYIVGIDSFYFILLALPLFVFYYLIFFVTFLVTEKISEYYVGFTVDFSDLLIPLSAAMAALTASSFNVIATIIVLFLTIYYFWNIYKSSKKVSGKVISEKINTPLFLLSMIIIFSVFISVLLGIGYRGVAYNLAYTGITFAGYYVVYLIIAFVLQFIVVSNSDKDSANQNSNTPNSSPGVVSPPIPSPAIDVVAKNSGIPPPPVTSSPPVQQGNVNIEATGPIPVAEEPKPVSRVVEQISGDDIIMVGGVGGGKTTFSCLFVYACQYMKGIPGFDYSIESSSASVKTGLESLLNGQWPSATIKTEMRTYTHILLKAKQQHKNKRVNFKINDISGEWWKQIADSENPEEALAYFVSQNPSLASLPKALAYIVTIDCDKFDQWDLEQYVYLDLFRAIVRINHTQKRINNAISLVFTKFDMIPAELQNITLEEFFAQNLPVVYSYIKEHFNQKKVEFFKSGIETDSNKQPQVFMRNNKRALKIIGGGDFGQYHEIIRWMLEL